MYHYCYLYVGGVYTAGRSVHFQTILYWLYVCALKFNQSKKKPKHSLIFVNEGQRLRRQESVCLLSAFLPKRLFLLWEQHLGSVAAD